jgi:hypothetical protein
MAERSYNTPTMKDCRYTETICQDFCTYYKEGKEELKCGGYSFLASALTSRELAGLSSAIRYKDALKLSVPEGNAILCDAVCKKCDFLIDGCDYRDNGSAPPCGGYILIDQLTRLSN